MNRWSRVFPGHPAEVAQARAFTRAVLDRHSVVEAAVLVVSEFATNAVVHSLSGLWCGSFVVIVESEASWVRVSVVDLGAETVPRLTPGDIDPEQESGRGLALVTSLVKGWGFEPVSVGLRVWAELVTDTAV
ncbi:anti-sigma regulatory factor (Ser/Thr protein kinase) [Haloactinospora alba]|uniref:Anti-sigma regulatory factor (Ser/Thr protein kinase) n=1 Tax=Haloactinospora alba TaxID=405555 RepID=A0A543NNR8_9ACTN|nr:ATP-binding protein [Haloactinospora alba]TQN33480.1 anti-sigma regulatory factor (Ser/Thr protein kinase) [Haloactinospora alba]